MSWASGIALAERRCHILRRTGAGMTRCVLEGEHTLARGVSPVQDVNSHGGMIGELEPPRIEQVLHEQVIGRIGCHARGRTYVVPVTYTYDGGAIVSHTGEGLKVQMMRENPFVCFEVEDLRHLPRWSSVIAHGRYEELEGDAAESALDRLIARLGASPPSPNEMPRQGAGVFAISYEQRPEVIFRIVLTEKTGRYDH